MIWIIWNILCVDHAAALPRTHSRLMKSQKYTQNAKITAYFSEFHAYQLHKPLFPICCIPRCGSIFQSRIVKFFTHLLKKPAFAFKTLLIF